MFHKCRWPAGEGGALWAACQGKAAWPGALGGGAPAESGCLHSQLCSWEPRGPSGSLNTRLCVATPVQSRPDRSRRAHRQAPVGAVLNCRDSVVTPPPSQRSVASDRAGGGGGGVCGQEPRGLGVAAEAREERPKPRLATEVSVPRPRVTDFPGNEPGGTRSSCTSSSVVPSALLPAATKWVPALRCASRPWRNDSPGAAPHGRAVTTVQVHFIARLTLQHKERLKAKQKSWFLVLMSDRGWYRSTLRAGGAAGPFLPSTPGAGAQGTHVLANPPPSGGRAGPRWSGAAARLPGTKVPLIWRTAGRRPSSWLFVAELGRPSRGLAVTS